MEKPSIFIAATELEEFWTTRIASNLVQFGCSIALKWWDRHECRKLFKYYDPEDSIRLKMYVESVAKCDGLVAIGGAYDLWVHVQIGQAIGLGIPYVTLDITRKALSQFAVQCFSSKQTTPDKVAEVIMKAAKKHMEEKNKCVGPT